jgi:uncharacterized delta-60 repeat protein
VTKRTRQRETCWLIAALLACVFLFALPSAAFAQAGSLDPIFGGDGKVTTNFTRGSDEGIGVAIQSDQKIVAAGDIAGQGGRFALARYNADGTLDVSFSGDGKVATNFTAGFDGAFDVAVQADGKIVAVGFAAGSGGRFALARYDSDGTLDVTFGGDGRVTTNFGAGLDVAFGIALQTDEKIVVTGRVGGGGGRIAVARYNVDGSRDTSFSTDGKVATDFTAGDDRADLLAVQADGKIVAAGTANTFRTSARFALVRYNADGSLDASFSGDGKVTTNFTAGFDGAFSVAVQSDQKIIAAGQAFGSMGLARYNSDGTLDVTFGGDGKVTTNFTSELDYADDLELDADGRIVAAGSARFFGDSRFALARYNTDGTLDTAFSGDGKVTTNFTSGRDRAFNVAIQADGNIVAVGRAGGGGGRFALARYLGA